MKSLFDQTATAIASLITVLLLSGPTVAAITFEQQDLDQDKFVVLAAPSAQQDRYNLIILEQLTDAKPCWQEQPNRPGVIQPLLLNFDFTNICGRSLSPSDYSIRQSGQDLGAQYRLSLVEQDSVLVLMGTPYQTRTQQPSLEIGRTQTLTPGFLKIELAPGWRLTQRTYRGQRQAHLYLTRDVVPAVDPRSTQIATRSPRTARSSAGLSRPAATPVPSRGVVEAQVPSPLTEPIEIPVPPPASPQSQVIEIPVPSPASAPAQIKPVLDPPPLVEELPPLDVNALSVPEQSIPLGNADNEPDVFAASAILGSDPETLAADTIPPPTTNRSQYRYRVLVAPVNQQEEALARDVVPDAFNTVQSGRRVLQVGAFEERADAEERVKLLQQYGFNGMIDVR